MKSLRDRALEEAIAHQENVQAILDGAGGVVRCDRCGKYTSTDEADLHDNDEILCFRCYT
jgi:formylmethanofuran dehydrogenase subunit E